MRINSERSSSMFIVGPGLFTTPLNYSQLVDAHKIGMNCPFDIEVSRCTADSKSSSETACTKSAF